MRPTNLSIFLERRRNHGQVENSVHVCVVVVVVVVVFVVCVCVRERGGGEI